MITKDNLKTLLLTLDFEQNGNQYSKKFADSEAFLKVDFDKNILIYPEDKGLKIHERQTCNFSANENFVVFECVHRLLENGYKPEHIELEPKWKLGHGASGGRADILIKDNQNIPLLIIECKTPGNEFNKAWKNTELHGDQLFSYAQQIPDTQFLCLYASDCTEKGDLFYVSHIISHKDNPKVLEEGKNLKAFKEGGDAKNRFTVWRDTYKKEFTTQGIFEPNIQSYQIGKDKYTLDDLSSIDAKDKEGKYHKFRTILRKHNVSGRENAFDVLVNLFLCKIVDEAENATDLKFYWKGIAYDSFFDLIDRLQALYKAGMERYLDQEIVYISNDQIENAFWAVKQKRNATKTQIKDYFRQLKFFTNNDFGFIDVHNEALFYQNAKVLLEVVQMWQDLRLKDQEQNQFLGDMFEYFLDQGIKQSEGQFFTPMPICKFILMSLPLESIIKDSTQAPKAIDYACGAGHFLNELAAQITPFIRQYKQTDAKAFFKEIIGIEKEYRLSKVAKVAAFMYGQEGIEILHHDALDKHPKVQKDSFNILVANPPFAVEGFLETLPEGQREQYALTQTVTDVANNRNIQCFFIERAKQLLSKGGVAGIIVPSSVLSNSDSTHIGSREILLQYFDIVALVELGSGTFGKTGTNTVVLFLRRKHQLPEPAEHYRNRVEDWFDNDTEMEAYQDLHFIKKYCEHIGIPFDHYQTLLHGKPSAELLACELFQNYKKDFDQSSDIKKLASQTFFKNYNPEQKQTEFKKRFLAYLQKIEKDKLFYYVLCFSNQQKVLIVKSPSDNKEQKQFLGYEWSAAKGNEGIKLTTDKQGKHLTPLYDPENRYNPDKINTLIQKNFSGNAVVIPEALQTYASLVSLVDLLDFSRKGFDKHISLSVKKAIQIETKWQIKKLSDLVEIIGGGTPDTTISEYWGGDIPWLSVVDFNKDERFVSKSEKTITELGLKNSSTKYLQKGDLIISARGTVGALAQLSIPMTFNQSCYGLRAKAEIIDAGYLFYVLKQEIQQFKENAYGSKFDSITIKTFDSINIPLPPFETQNKIVQACEAIDTEVAAVQGDIELAVKELDRIKIEVFNKGFTQKKVSDCALINPSKTEIKQVDENTLISFVEMASVSEAGFINRKQDRLLKDLKKGSYTYFKENDIIIAKITPCMENGKCAFATDLTNGLAMGSSEFHVIRANEEVVLGKYIFALLNRESVRKEAEKNMTGSSGHRRVPASFYENYRIPVPDLTTQQQLITEIAAHEISITAAQKIIDEAASKKQAILNKYL